MKYDKGDKRSISKVLWEAPLVGESGEAFSRRRHLSTWREEEGCQAKKGDEPPTTMGRQAQGVVKRPMEPVYKVPVGVL